MTELDPFQRAHAATEAMLAVHEGQEARPEVAAVLIAYAGLHELSAIKHRLRPEPIVTPPKPRKRLLRRKD